MLRQCLDNRPGHLGGAGGTTQVRCECTAFRQDPRHRAVDGPTGIEQSWEGTASGQPIEQQLAGKNLGHRIGAVEMRDIRS